MSRLGRKPLCLHNDAICLPHIKDKSLWASKRLKCDFPNVCLKNHDEKYSRYKARSTVTTVKKIWRTQFLHPHDVGRFTGDFIMYFSYYRLKICKNRSLKKLASRFCMQFVEQPNMSEPNPDLSALNKNSGGSSGGGTGNAGSGSGQGGPNNGPGPIGTGNSVTGGDGNSATQNNILTNNSNNRASNDSIRDPRLQKPSSNGGNSDPRISKGGGGNNNSTVASNGHAHNAPLRHSQANNVASNKSRLGNNTSMNRAGNKR
ncbi:unnamed protein product, partial [Meganyctiphanes norvegica]